MRLGFTGSRFVDLKVREVVTEIVEAVLRNCGRCTVGHGNAPGVDQVVDMVARRLGHHVVVFHPQRWEKEYLLRRDIELVRWSDRVVAIFVNEYTRGTAFTMAAARVLGKTVTAFLVRGEVKQLENSEIERIVRQYRRTVLKYINITT